MKGQRPTDPLADMGVFFPAADNTRAFWQSLGRFLDAYSVLETIMNVMVVSHSSITWELGKALFLPLRVDAASNYLKRLIATKHIRGARANEIADIIEQLNHINKLRNDIIHLGARPAGIIDLGIYTVTNRMYARSAEGLRRSKVTVKIIDQMFGDCVEIGLRFIVMLIAKRRKEGNASPFDDVLIRFVGKAGFSLRRVRPVAWRYRPPAQSRRQSRRRARALRQPRRPEPSSG